MVTRGGLVTPPVRPKKTFWFGGISLLVGFYTTLVLQNLWNWFAVPALHVSAISCWLMFGLNMILGLMFEGSETGEADRRWKVPLTILDACVPEEKQVELRESLKHETEYGCGLALAAWSSGKAALQRGGKDRSG